MSQRVLFTAARVVASVALLGVRDAGAKGVVKKDHSLKNGGMEASPHDGFSKGTGLGASDALPPKELAGPKAVIGGEELPLANGPKRPKGDAPDLVGGEPVVGKGGSVPSVSTDAIAANTAAVVRIRAAKSAAMHCTGVIVKDAVHGIGVLTAGHCLYSMQADVFNEFRSGLYVDGVGQVSTSTAKMPTAFRRYADGGGTYAVCLAKGLADIAFLPIANTYAAAAWAIGSTQACGGAPWTLFGYGVDETGKPSKILRKGTFHSNGALAGAILRVRGSTAVRASFGDSGGPVTTYTTTSDLGVRRPTVCSIAIAGDTSVDGVPLPQDANGASAYRAFVVEVSNLTAVLMPTTATPAASGQVPAPGLSVTPP